MRGHLGAEGTTAGGVALRGFISDVFLGLLPQLGGAADSKEAQCLLSGLFDFAGLVHKKNGFSINFLARLGLGVALEGLSLHNLLVAYIANGVCGDHHDCQWK